MARPNRFMTHVAIHEADDSGSAVTWGDPVSDDSTPAIPAT